MVREPHRVVPDRASILACLASITVEGCAPLQVSRLGRQAKPNVQLPRVSVVRVHNHPALLRRRETHPTVLLTQ